MSELRKLLRAERTKRRMTQRQVGVAIRVSGSLIAAIEQGRVIPQPDTARALDELFGSGDAIQRAADAARADNLPPWLRPWADSEQRATVLRWWEPLYVPGLLQIEPYARAVLIGSQVPEDQIERTIQSRRERQAATVERTDPPMLSAVIAEGALTCGPPDLCREQVRHLLDMSHRHRTQVLVVPRSAGLHAGLSGAFILATLPGGRRVGYVDDQLRGRLVADAADLDRLEVSWEIVTGLALPVQSSRDLLERVIKDYD